MIEFLPVSIGIGLVVSLILSEALGMAGAGLVVPGYFALHLTKPLSIAVTFVSGLAAFGAMRALSGTLILFGRRRTILMILAGYLTGMIAKRISGAVIPDADFYPVIGFIIPGLIAIWLDRRGVVETVCSLITASVIVRLLLIMIYGVEINQ
jgi:gamma-polyglutamate biosynthesis protein CapC